MELKATDNFAILLCNEFNDEKSIIDVVRKTSLKKHIGFNRATINNERAYIIYDIDRKYFFNFGTNKKLKFIWKSREDFFIIDFGENTKGEILNYLTFEETSGKKIEGNIEYLNINKKFRHLNKVQLVGGQMLDEKEPHLYEYFVIYIKN